MNVMYASGLLLVHAQTRSSTCESKHFLTRQSFLSGSFSSNVLNKQGSLSCPYNRYEVVPVVDRSCR